MTTSTEAPALSAEQLGELLPQLSGADSVELKLTVPDEHHRSTVIALGMDVLDAQLRQVCFFDTPALDLDSHGLVVRARRIQGRSGDSVVKLRPVHPSHLPSDLRAKKSFGVEVDAMPGGFVSSGSMKSQVDNSRVQDVMLSRRPVRKLFSSSQREFFDAHAPSGLDLDSLAILGPIHVLKLKFRPVDFKRSLVAEVWLYPDGSRCLELSTKCQPSEAFQVAAEAKAYLGGHGVDLGAPQQTKTKTALRYFADHVDTGPATAATSTPAPG
jgi:hypothetical protein